jgi:hypothetical protein
MQDALPGAIGISSWRCFPRVDDVHPGSFKRTGVAGGDGEAVGEGDGGNEGIRRFNRQAGSAGLGQQLSYRDHGKVIPDRRRFPA